AGYLSTVDITWPWFGASAGFGTTGVLALVLMHESRGVERPPIRSLHRSLPGTIRDGFLELRASPAVRALCLLGAVVGFAASTVWMTWPPRMRDLSGEGFWLLGWMWAIFALIASAGSACTARLVGRVGRPALLCVAELCRAIGLAAAALTTGFSPALGGLLVEEFGAGVAFPAGDAWLNDLVSAERRAT